MSERALRRKRPLLDITNNVAAQTVASAAKPKRTRASSQPVAIITTESTLPVESSDVSFEIMPDAPPPIVDEAPAPVEMAVRTVSIEEPSITSDDSLTNPSSTEKSMTESTAPTAPLSVVVAPVAGSPVARPPKPEVKRKCVFRVQKCPDPAQCFDILDDLYGTYYDLEDAFAAKPYMSRQEDINVKMRSILVDWLLEVHYKFKLQSPTLWLCVNIIDRYLNAVSIPRGKLQLVGVVALFIACKFEEIQTPNIKDCIFITDYAYQKEDLVRMESMILQQLDYQVFVPTGFHFLTRYLNAIGASVRTRNLAFYYAERLLQEPETLEYSPHHVAASSVYAALRQEQQHVPATKAFAEKAGSMLCWNSILRTETGMSESDVIPLARIIVSRASEVSETASKRLLIAAKKKYSYNVSVSSLPLPDI